MSNLETSCHAALDGPLFDFVLSIEFYLMQLLCHATDHSTGEWLAFVL
jgi:hypothetical protein